MGRFPLNKPSTKWCFSKQKSVGFGGKLKMRQKQKGGNYGKDLPYFGAW